MANQDQQRNQGQANRDRDRENNLGQAGSGVHRPAGTSGQQPAHGSQPERSNQQNQDEEDSGIGNRSTNR